jgi:hypothetical protein
VLDSHARPSIPSLIPLSTLVVMKIPAVIACCRDMWSSPSEDLIIVHAVRRRAISVRSSRRLIPSSSFLLRRPT